MIEPRVIRIGLVLAFALLAGCRIAPTPTLPPRPIVKVPTPDTRLTSPDGPEADQVLAEIQQRYDCGPQDADCQATAQANKSSITYGTVSLASRPEWSLLFPGARFYLVPRVATVQGQARQQNKLIVRYQDQWYEPGQFQALLDAFGIQVTNEQVETVSKAFVALRLANYLDRGIIFSDWREETATSILDQPYNYTLSVWTQTQGLKIQWRLMFDKGSLVTAGGQITNRHLGVYTDVPFDFLPLPSDSDLEYWRGVGH
ncbi:MAG: hypothetical protein WCF84_08425 [Anaerolineae bacterium]